MKYRKFEKLSWQISEIGFGAWAIGGDMWGPQDDNESTKALHKAIDLGVNFIDTAQGYGSGHSEELVGKVLKERKEEIYVATKVPPKGFASWPPPDNYDSGKSFPGNYIIEECEKSLKRLQRAYLDVYQFHTWASAFNIGDDEARDFAEAAAAVAAPGGAYPKVGRNDPCPCGSGKKYKQCHGKLN